LNFFNKIPPPKSNRVLGFHVLQGPRNTKLHTFWIPTAEIAFDGYIFQRIKPNIPKWTDLHTHFTALASFLVYYNGPGGKITEDSPGRADSFTDCILALQTSNRNGERGYRIIEAANPGTHGVKLPSVFKGAGQLAVSAGYAFIGLDY